MGSLSFFVSLKAKIEQPHEHVLAEWPWRTFPRSAWLLSSVVDVEASPGLSGGCLEVCLIRVSKRKICPALKNKLCFRAGVTISGFPFDFGRAPYKGKRPLKDMIGSYRNRHSSGDPLTEGMSGSGGAGKPEVQLQVQSQQEEVERLKKDLSSQKVPFPLHIPLSSTPPLPREARAWGQILALCFSESSFTESPFPQRVLCSL